MSDNAIPSVHLHIQLGTCCVQSVHHVSTARSVATKTHKTPPNTNCGRVPSVSPGPTCVPLSTIHTMLPSPKIPEKMMGTWVLVSRLLPCTRCDRTYPMDPASHEVSIVDLGMRLWYCTHQGNVVQPKPCVRHHRQRACQGLRLSHLIIAYRISPRVQVSLRCRTCKLLRLLY